MPPADHSLTVRKVLRTSRGAAGTRGVLEDMKLFY